MLHLLPGSNNFRSRTTKLKCTHFKSPSNCCYARCKSRWKGTMSNFTVHGHRIFARWEPLNLGSLPHMRRRKLRIGGARTRDLCPHYSSPQSSAQSLPSLSEHSGFLPEGWPLGFFGGDSGKAKPMLQRLYRSDSLLFQLSRPGVSDPEPGLEMGTFIGS